MKNFLGTIYIKKKQALLHEEEVFLRNFSFTLSLQSQINDKGTFYVPVFENIEPIKDTRRLEIIDECFHGFHRKALPVTNGEKVYYNLFYDFMLVNSDKIKEYLIRAFPKYYQDFCQNVPPSEQYSFVDYTSNKIYDTNLNTD